MVKINHEGLTKVYSADEAINLLVTHYKSNFTQESAVAVVNAMIMMQRVVV